MRDLNWIDVLLVSALPFSELRGGLPLAIYLGFDPIRAYILSVIGNFLPIPFLLLFLGAIEKLALRTPLAPLYTKIVERTEKRKGLVERYGYLGLIMFVAIPLPFTGAWTGSLLAFLLRLNRIKATICILVGILIAGLIVLTTSVGVLSMRQL